MRKNDDFYAKNVRFKSFIDYYSQLLKYQGANVDLWEHLFAVMVMHGDKYPDAYYFKCLKNEYIRLSMIEAEKRVLIELNEEIIAEKRFEDRLLDRMELEKAFEELTDKERDVLRLHYALGYSVSEVAKQKNVTRQNVNNIKVRALKKLRQHANLDKMRPK